MNCNRPFQIVMQAILSLGWRDVLVLHDNTSEVSVPSSLEVITIAYMDYDITYYTDEHLLSLLNETHHVTQPVLRLILLCDNLRAVRLLKQMDHFNTFVNSPFDMRHSSRVLKFGSSEDKYPIMASNTQVENVALVEFLGNYSTPFIWSLIFSKDRRDFVSVPQTSWPEVKLESVFPNIQFGYNGRQVTVVMKQYSFSHGHINVGDMTVSGLQYRTLNYFAQSLNFSLRVIPPREDEWGRDIQGSWTGVVGMLQRKEAELAAATLTINEERETVIDHVLPPLMENRLMILYKEEDSDVDHLAVYLHPFQYVVFMYLLISLLLYSLILCFENHVNEQVLYSDFTVDTAQCKTETFMLQKLLATYVTEVLHGFMASVRQDSRMSVSRNTKRILVAFWWIFTVIISCIYCGAILAALAVRIKKPPFSNLAELAERRDYKIGYDPSTIISIYLQNSSDSAAVSVSNRVRDASLSDPDVLSSNITKHFEKIQEGKYAFLVGVLPAVYKTRTNCKWKAVDSKFGTRHFAFAVPKQSPLKANIQKSMYHLQDNGILGKIQEEWLLSIPKNECPVTEFPSSISLTQLASVFIIIGAAVCFSVVVLCGELLWALKKTRMRKST